jgi:hypothetical protein
MDQQRFIETELLLRHRHTDGSWGEMVEDRSHHDPADHDPERRWGLGRIFRCSSCPEAMTVTPGGEGAAGDEHGR